MERILQRPLRKERRNPKKTMNNDKKECSCKQLIKFGYPKKAINCKHYPKD